MKQSDALLRLQEIDLELLRENKALESMSQLDKMEQFSRAERKLKSNATKICGARKDIEIEIEDMEADKAHLQDIIAESEQALAAAETKKEKQQLAGTLTHLAKRIEKIDFAMAGKREKLAQAQKAESNVAVLQQRLRAEKAALEGRIAESSQGLKREIADLEKERQEVLSLLDEKLVETYEQKCRKYQGLAVEKLQGNKPSVCRVSLQASSYSDVIHAGEDIQECPYCRRMLVVETESSRDE